MIKGIILGVAITIALVGYGVVDTAQIETAGNAVKAGVNTLATTIEAATQK